MSRFNILVLAPRDSEGLAISLAVAFGEKADSVQFHPVSSLEEAENVASRLSVDVTILRVSDRKVVERWRPRRRKKFGAIISLDYTTFQVVVASGPEHAVFPVKKLAEENIHQAAVKRDVNETEG